MFHAHQSEFAELGWMGLFEARRRAVTPDTIGRRADVPVVARGARRRSLLLAAPHGALIVTISARPTRCGRRGTPPVERLTIERARLEPDGIVLTVLNDGPDAVTIAQVTVDDAYWAFTRRSRARR